MWTVTAAHFMLYTTDKCGIYWYSSLADTLDTTYINKLGFLLKSLLIFLITMLPDQSIILRV